MFKFSFHPPGKKTISKCRSFLIIVQTLPKSTNKSEKSNRGFFLNEKFDTD